MAISHTFFADLHLVGAAVATTLSFLTLCGLSILHVVYNQPREPSKLWLFFFDGTFDRATWQGIDVAGTMETKVRTCPCAKRRGWGFGFSTVDSARSRGSHSRPGLLCTRRQYESLYGLGSQALCR